MNEINTLLSDLRTAENTYLGMCLIGGLINLAITVVIGKWVYKMENENIRLLKEISQKLDRPKEIIETKKRELAELEKLYAPKNN